MENINFEFAGRSFSGYLLYDKAGGEYVWFVFNDDEVARIFGDTIAFHFRQKKLVTVYQYANNAPFIEYLRKKVEAVLSLD